MRCFRTFVCTMILTAVLLPGAGCDSLGLPSEVIPNPAGTLEQLLPTPQVTVWAYPAPQAP